MKSVHTVKAAEVNIKAGVSKSAGFTLVEIMITVAIVAILASIAMPAYNSYIIKSEIRSVQSDLMALSLGFENQYQRTLSYPVLSAADRADIAKIKEKIKGWNPANTENFNIKLSVSTATEYTLIAEGKSGSRQAGCKLSLTHKNERAATDCKYIGDGKWL